jgi:hypothetical protein
VGMKGVMAITSFLGCCFFSWSDHFSSRGHGLRLISKLGGTNKYFSNVFMLFRGTNHVKQGSIDLYVHQLIHNIVSMKRV